MSWVVVSKDKVSDKFYPIDVIANMLPNTTRMTYQEAGDNQLSFWKDKRVIFHVTWAGKYLKVWDKFYRHIARNCSRFWMEFDADGHMNMLWKIDKSFASHMCMYYKLHKHCKRFVWELPMAFNPFIGAPTRVPAGLYQRKRELPIQKKDIDFLGFIDHNGYNAANTFRLLTSLSEKGRKVKCIIIHPGVYKWYKKGKWNFELIRNSKTEPGQKLFHDLLDRSKVLVDLSHRITLGRNLYEALFHGALAICPRTYGASELLFPDLTIDTLPIDLTKVRGMCMQAMGKWSVAEIQKYRNKAADVAGLQRTIRRLQVASK